MLKAQDGGIEARPTPAGKFRVMTGASAVKKVGDEDFEKEVLGASMPVLACFMSEQAEVGNLTRTIAESVAHTRAGRLKVVLLDIEKTPKTTRRFAVMTTPTFIIFRNGEKRVTAVGYQRESDIEKLLDRFSERDATQET